MRLRLPATLFPCAALAACVPPQELAAPHAAASQASPSGPEAKSPLLAEGFVALGEEHGVRVYRREKSAGVELAAEADLLAAPGRVLRILLDYPNHPKWQHRLVENRVLARGTDSLDVYQRLDLPMLDDRDFTLHVTWGSDGDVLWMHFIASNDRGPAEVPGVVRVRTQEGNWRLTPIDGGRATHALYRFHIDLGGSFPAWLGRGQAADEVPALIEKMRNELPSYP